MDGIDSRTEMLIGEGGTRALHSSAVMLFGLGGVGGYAFEALVRAGVGTVYIVDFDVIKESNINRQILATSRTVGMKKTDAAEARAAEIRADVRVVKIDAFADTDTADGIVGGAPRIDYIIDAIDTVSGKLAIITAAKAREIPIISCMGTGNKLDAEGFHIADISKSEGCPLARVMRRELRVRGITGVDVLYSAEHPCESAATEREEGRNIPGSISYMPAIAGLMTAGHAIGAIVKNC